MLSLFYSGTILGELGVLNPKPKDFGATNGLSIPVPQELRICWREMFLGAKLFIHESQIIFDSMLSQILKRMQVHIN